jgi:hypothetical protein
VAIAPTKSNASAVVVHFVVFFIVCFSLVKDFSV